MNPHEKETCLLVMESDGIGPEIVEATLNVLSRVD